MTLSETQLKLLYLDFMKLFDGDCWIAGGAITNVYWNYQPADIDLFFPSVEARDAAVKVSVDAGYEIVAGGPHFIKLKDTKNTKPLMIPLSGCTWDDGSPRTRPKLFDVIYLGDTPQETLKKFNFSINQIAITKPTDTKPNGVFHLTSTAEEDLIAKKLKITGEHPSRFLPNRARFTIKNLRKGFTMDTTELAKWFTDIPSNINTSQKQIEWLINFLTTYKK